jgi:hypothetical protein
MNNFFKFFLVLVLLCSIVTIEAQKEQDTTTIDGIKKLIRQSTYYDSFKVFHFGAKAIKMAKSQESLSDESTTYQYYGNFCYFSKNYTKAKEYYKPEFGIKFSSKRI